MQNKYCINYFFGSVFIGFVHLARDVYIYYTPDGFSSFIQVYLVFYINLVFLIPVINQLIRLTCVIISVVKNWKGLRYAISKISLANLCSMKSSRASLIFNEITHESFKEFNTKDFQPKKKELPSEE